MTGDNGNRENGKGPILSDRRLAGEVRNLILAEIERIFTKKDLTPKEATLKENLLLRMSGFVMPRLNEITGEDGGDIKINIINYGSNYPIQLVPGNTPAGSSSKPFTVQSPDVAPESA